MNKYVKAKEFPLILILVLLCVVLSIRNPTFMTLKNVLDIFDGGAVLFILSLGMTLVIITGGIDVSVAAMTSASAVVVGLLIPHGTTLPSMILVLLAGILVGVLMGLVNGFLIAYAKIPSIVTTLATLSIIGGMTRYLTNGTYINSTNFPPIFMKFAVYHLFGVSILIYMSVILGLFTWYLLKHLKVGRQVLAIGGNPTSALRAGISLTRVQLFVYGYMGLLSGFAAIALTSYNRAVDPNGMSGFELTVIAAVVLGGANIMGGYGSILGTVLGCLLLQVINNGLILAHIDTFWQQIVIGIVLLVAVSYDSLRQKQLESKLARIEIEHGVDAR